MQSSRSHQLQEPIARAIRDGSRAGLRTAVWLLSIMIPVSFAVLVLRWSGALGYVGDLFAPVFRFLDLPGSSALAFLSSLFISPYTAIAVMGELDLSVREVTILAMMILTAHNFLVEIAVLGTTGSRPLRMIAVRLVVALLAAWVLSLVLPARLDAIPAAIGNEGASLVASAGEVRPPFGRELGRWAVDSLLLTGRVAAILFALMIGERLLQEFGVVRWLGRRLGWLMRAFGLPRETTFLWVVSNTLGLTYGAGVLKKEVAEGQIPRREGDLLNHHVAICHSLLEDTLLFVALGVPAFWITVPRLAFAVLVVWERRAELAIRDRRRERASRS